MPETPALTPSTIHETAAKYRDTQQKHYMSLEESIALSHHLAQTLAESDITLDNVIGIANGALLPTKVIADDLNLPYSFVSIRRKGSTIKSRLANYPALLRFVSAWFRIPLLRLPLVFVMNQFTQLSAKQSIDKGCVTGKEILLVDDSIESGQTLARAIEMIRKENPDCSIKTAVIAAKYQSVPEKRGFTPDYYIGETMQHFPWSSNNPEFSTYQQWLIENQLDKEQV